MCGVLFCIESELQDGDSSSSLNESTLQRRGPGGVHQNQICIHNAKYTAKLYMNFLEGVEQDSEFLRFGDYIILLDCGIFDSTHSKCYVKKIIDEIKDCDGTIEAIVHVCSHFKGAFAFVLIQESKCRLFFGRDKFGQRSLVCNSGLTYLSSICLSDVCSIFHE